MAFTTWPGTEIKRVRNSRSAPIPKSKRPEAFDNDWVAMRVLKQASEFAGRIESHDRAGTKIANQQLICVLAECAGSKGDSPGGAYIRKLASSVRTSNEAVKCAGLRIEHINNAMTFARDIIFFVGVLFGESYENHSAD